MPSWNNVSETLYLFIEEFFIVYNFVLWLVSELILIKLTMRSKKVDTLCLLRECTYRYLAAEAMVAQW